MEDLAIRVRLEGVEDANRQVGQLSTSLMGLVNAFSMALTVLGSVSALRFADEVTRIRNQFEALTGSAQEAESILRRVFQIAQTTPFDTVNVAQFAAMLRSAGVAGAQLERELTALLNLASAAGISRSDFTRFAENLLQIRSGAGGLMDIRQMLRAAPGISRFLAEQLGRDRLPLDELAALIQREGPERFYQRLIEAGEARAGAATRVTPLTALANFVELIQMELLPTGELLGKILGGIVGILSPLVRLLGAFNRALGGVPALLVGLAAAVASAATALRALSASGIGRAVTDTWATLLVLLTLIAGRLRTVAIRIGGLAGFLRLTLAGGIAALVGAIGRAVGGELGELLQAIAAGGGIGALVGSIVPALGTALGAILGALVGAIGFLVKRLFFPATTESAQARTARNTERMAQTLDQIAVKLVGGGTGAGALRTRFEAEMALARLMEQGVA